MTDGVEVIENTWIPMPDGCRLAARIWLPAGARHSPVPALLEYLPYRKRDFTRLRDEPMHRYFAQHGYASLRVDLRGSGDSEGLLYDEYSRAEHDDGVALIDWIAAQPWCDGAVGMFGISWGGFNALQLAARRPPALRAIISLCASDDRYSDDAHYMGGCLLTENLQWGAIFMLNQALPPDPEIAGEHWREQWRARIVSLPNFPAQWMREPTRSDYWRYGSVSDQIERIDVPVYAIGGWADGYSNAVPRLVASLQAPVKGLIGPWAHTFPHNGVPGPAIGFLQEALRWWGRWLRDERNGIDEEPALRVWMQEAIAPAPQYETWPGRWVAEERWPSDNIAPRSLYLTSLGLDRISDEPQEFIVASLQSCGLRGGEWCAFGADGEMPRDQRPDDGLSLSFDTKRLRERTEILGAPVVHLDLSSDRPDANLVVRLCDVAPDGSSLRVSYGVLNLAHRDSHAAPAPLETGTRYRVRLQLNDIAHAFPAGHRIRLAISTAYWPIIWPSPGPASLHLYCGESRVVLPVRQPQAADADLREFEPPAAAPGARPTQIRKHEFRRRLGIDLTTNEVHYELDGSEFGDASLVHLDDIGLDVGYTLSKRFVIQESDPLSARESIGQRVLMSRGAWKIEVRLDMALHCDAANFYIKGTLQAAEGGEPFATREWHEIVPRRFV